MQNNTVGIIGGFGPEATSEFYLRLVSEFRKNHSGEQPHLLIENAAVPRSLEHELLIEGNNTNFAPLLVAAARTLEKNGAGVIVLPCNTLHVHEERIRNAISIPFISIIDETARFFSTHQIKRVGFLGTSVTIKENLFKKKTENVRFITVPKLLQKKIDTGLDRFVGDQQSGELSRALRSAFGLFQKRGLQDVLVACTDFHDFCPKNAHVIDTLDILVEATVNML